MSTNRRAATRAQVADAALHVIATKGAQAATIEEICEAAGFTRGAFYSNFASKDELFIAVLERRCEAYLSAVQGAVDGLGTGASLDERLQHAAEQFVAVAGEDFDTVIMLTELRLHAAREPRIRAALLQLDETVEASLASLVEQGLQANGLRLTIGVDDALTLLHAVHDQTALTQLSRGDQPDSTEAARLLAVAMRNIITTA